MTHPTRFQSVGSAEAVQSLDSAEPMRDMLAALRVTLDSAESLTDDASEEQRASAEADLCLASRSAYFDLYTTIVLFGTVDPLAERELDDLFRRALNVMRPGAFRESVQNRHDEFREECQRVRESRVEPDPSSSI